MRRFDLRHLKNDFLQRLEFILKNELSENEAGIFMFDVGDFENISKAENMAKKENLTLLNSIRFNEVDWIIVLRKDKV